MYCIRSLQSVSLYDYIVHVLACIGLWALVVSVWSVLASPHLFCFTIVFNPFKAKSDADDILIGLVRIGWKWEGSIRDLLQ
jgi:hypothetical protein